jgi:hypothetical protein
MEDPSFENVCKQILWELCIDAATKGKTKFSILLYKNLEDPKTQVPMATLEAAAEELVLTENGAIRIHGDWIAGGRRGNLDIVYVKQFSPTATPFYIVRLLHELIRLKIARGLDKLGSPTVDFVDGSRESQ